jgi:hypothetical protein
MATGTYQICEEIAVGVNQFRRHASFCTVYEGIFSKFINLKMRTNIDASMTLNKWNRAHCYFYAGNIMFTLTESFSSTYLQASRIASW